MPSRTDWNNTHDDLPPPPGFPARFQAGPRVGVGLGREQWDAYDTWREQPVTLLRAIEADAATWARLQRAYRFLTLADGPHLHAALDLSRSPQGDAWLAVARVAPLEMPRNATADELRTWAAAGARALLEGHRHGLLHRFVSPAAFMQTPEGHVVLSLWSHNARIAEPDGSVNGMVPYIAPEALAGWPVPASDFYALGVVLHAMATGQPPHAGLEGPALVRAQREAPPAPLRTVRPDLPVSLTAVVDRLLAYDPTDRFPDGLALLAALKVPLMPALGSPPVDHEAPIQRLMKAYDSFEGHGGGAFVMTGASGSGKSTVLRQFGVEVVLRGGLVAAVHPEPGLDRMAALERWMDQRGFGLTDADLPGAMALDPAAPAAARHLLDQTAMITRLAEMSSKHHIALVFEDLGAHEEETLIRLEKLLAGYGSRIMVVVSVRGEEAAGGRVLARLKRNPLVRELAVHPLPEPASRALVAHALGPGALELPVVHEAIAASGGHPYTLVETLRTLVAERLLALGPGGWTTPQSVRHLPLAPSIDALLSARLELLSPEARRLAAVVALFGSVEATRPLLAAVLDTALTTELANELQALVAQRWLTRDGGSYRLVHGLMRPVLERVLPLEEQRALHARLAALLPSLEAPLETIAEHWAASGDGERAAETYMAAAEAAEGRGAPLAAFRRRQSAYRLLAHPARRLELGRRLAPTASHTDPAFAVELLTEALATPLDDPVEAAYLACLLASSQTSLGRYEAAREGLAEAARHAPAEPAWLHGLFASYEAFSYMLQGAIPPARRAARQAQALLQDAPAQAMPVQMATYIAGLSASVYSVYLGEPDDQDTLAALAGHPLAAAVPFTTVWPWLHGALGGAMEGHLSSVREQLARARASMDRAGASPAAEVRALSAEAMIAVREGELDQALRSAGAAVAYARVNYPYPQLLGLALAAHAEALLAAGQTREAEVAATEVLVLNAGEGHHVTGVATLIRAEAILRARPAEAARLVEEALAAATRPDTLNRYVEAMAWRLMGECRLATGHPAEALEALERSLELAERHDWPYPRVQALLAIARHHKLRRQFGRMQRVVMRAIRVAQGYGFFELLRQARQLSRFGVNGFAPLAELQRLLDHQGPLEAMVAHGLELALGLVRADRAAVYLVDGGTPRLLGSHPDSVDPLVSSHDLITEVLREGRTRQRHGVVMSQPGTWLVDADVRALLAIPLAAPHGPLGVFYLDRRAIAEPFTRGEVARVEALSAYMALAMDRVLQAHRHPGPAGAEGRTGRLEAALAQALESDRSRRGFLATVTGDLRHQLAQLHEALATLGDNPQARGALLEALQHAEHLAEVLERGIRE